MNKILIHITLIAVALLVAMTPSCSSDEMIVKPVPPPVGPFDDGELPIDLPVTRAVNDGDKENQIKTARLIVIKNSVVANNIPITVASGDVTISAIIPVGTIDMFLIANEDPSWGFGAINVGATYFSENIEKKTLTFTAYPVVKLNDNPIPMYKQFKGLHVSNEGTTFTFEGSGITIDKLGEVERLYAKVKLEIKAIFEDMDNGGDPIQLDSMSVKSMPKFSYLTPSVGLLYPASGEYFDGVITVTAGDGPKTGYYEVKDEPKPHFIDSITWYIPEHRLSDPTKMTYLSVKASLQGNTDPELQREYKIAIGDGMVKYTDDHTPGAKNADMFKSGVPLKDLFITRNTFYTVKAQIKSFDIMNESEIDVISKIILWEETWVDGTDIWNYELKVSQDEFHIQGANDYYGVVTIETNDPGGWSVAGFLNDDTSTNSIQFENPSSPGSYGTNLPAQTGTQLRFKCTDGLSGYINVTAGPIVKKIKLIRTP
jgi:hypothetical protein